VKKSSRIKASHVNTGTAVSGRKQGNFRKGGALRHPRLLAEVESSETTAYGGLALAATAVKTLELPRRIDKSLSLLKQHRPYTESDHVLTHVYNLFLGGSAIEDINNLQCSEPVKRVLGAEQICDPTSAGDFLRRFNPESIEALDRITDETHRLVWRKAYGKRKRKECFLDLDSHVHEIYGSQKQGADFSYTGKYGFHPLIASLGGTQEVLRIVNRSGNRPSAEGAVELVEELIPFLSKSFRKVIVRGDSAFAIREIYDTCEENEQFFAIVSPQERGFLELAELIPARKWRSLKEKKVATAKKKRRRGKNRRRAVARARGKRDLKLQKEWITEIPYTPFRSEHDFRLIIRKQKIEESNQKELFTRYRFRYVVTNLPQSYSSEAALRLTYRRADQENVIEQLQNGISAMKMPCQTFIANSAYLACARLAHNLKAWLAMLALPAEAMRWEWKRFRLSFIYLAARVVKKSRQTIVRFADSHRFARAAALGIAKLNI